MKNKIIMSTLIFSLVIFGGFSIPTFANETESQNNNEEQAIQDYIDSTHEIEGVRGVDYDIVVIDTIEIDPTSEPNHPISRIWSGYSIRNARHSGGGGRPIGIGKSGAPGGTITWIHSWTGSLAVNLGFGISYGEASSALGFTVANSHTEGINYSFAVPHTHNGKKVSRAELRGTFNYDRYSYDVYKGKVKQGSGSVERGNNIHIFSVIHYK